MTGDRTKGHSVSTKYFDETNGAFDVALDACCSVRRYHDTGAPHEKRSLVAGRRNSVAYDDDDYDDDYPPNR